MLRPATPLTVILLVAFVLTLLAVLSAPIIKAIPLGQNDGTTYGVFGYCQGGTSCTFGIGYNPPNSNDNNFDIDQNTTRHTLANILIVHPVACLFQLICVILALVAHFHSPSHSSRYLLALIIFMLPTLLLTLLSFLIDILLFIPHVGWAGWLVLGAVVLDVLGGIMLCAMRRTLVSRKARRKRIEQNAEMNGENFYNRQATERINPIPTTASAASARADSPPPLDDQPTVPMVNGAPGADKLPHFAQFENRRISDDRLPLNERTMTATTTSTAPGRPSQDGSEAYGPGTGRGMPMNRGRGGRQMGPPRDEYGNLLPPSAAFGPRGGDPRAGSRGRGGPGMGPRGGYDGRGGFGYGPGPGRGGPPGGPGAPMGAAFGAGAAAGALAGSRGPPPGYTNDDYPMSDRPPMNGGYGQRGQSPGPPSAPGYGQRRQSPGPPSNVGYGRSPSAGRQPPIPAVATGYGPAAGDPVQANDPYARAESPPPLPGTEANAAAIARAESPPPLHAPSAAHEPQMHPMEEPVIGQAVEMDARTGSPAQTPSMPSAGFPRIDSPLRQNFHPPQSPSSMYSGQPSQRGDSVAYVPARAAWQSQRHQTPPIELDSTSTSQAHAARGRKASETYYEDVDPRFSQEQSVPAVLVSGGSADPHAIGIAVDGPADQRRLAPQHTMQHNNSYGSDSSHFTSVSERGVNPHWDGYDPQGPAARRRPPHGRGGFAQGY